MGKIKKAIDVALDMSESARKKRAKEMGFSDSPVYHGTNKQFDQFDPYHKGAYSSSDTEGNISLTPYQNVAKNYASGDAKKIGEKYYLSEYDDELERMMQVEVTPRVMELLYRGKIKNVDAAGKSHDPKWMIEQERLAKAEGFDGVQYQNFQDSAFYSPLEGSTETLKIFDPKNLRSVDAAFDPSKIDSSNLLANYAPVGVMAGAAALGLQNQEAQASDELALTNKQKHILDAVESRLYKDMTPRQKNIISNAKKRQRGRGGVEAKQRKQRDEQEQAAIANINQRLESGEITASQLSKNQIDQVRQYRESQLPELTGLSDRISYSTALAAATTTDPYEMAAILKQDDSDLAEITTPDGEVLMHNRRTGAITSLNRPGFSKVDVIQGGALMGLLGLAGLTRGRGPQVLAGMGLMGAAEGAQTAKGGDFDLADVLLEGLLPLIGGRIGPGFDAVKHWAKSGKTVGR